MVLWKSRVSFYACFRGSGGLTHIGNYPHELLREDLFEVVFILQIVFNIFEFFSLHVRVIFCCNSVLFFCIKKGVGFFSAAYFSSRPLDDSSCEPASGLNSDGCFLPDAKSWRCVGPEAWK